MDPDDTSDRSDQHIEDIGLSDCKFVPSVISFPGHDPLGQRTTREPSPTMLPKFSDKSSSEFESALSLGQQADALTDSNARLYALGRISRASQVLVSRKIVYSVLDVLVKTLNIEEISRALVDLGVDNVQLLLDYMKIYFQNSSKRSSKNLAVPSMAKASFPCDASILKVVSVAVKVFLCRSRTSFTHVANYCSSVLLSEAKGN